MVRLNAFGIPIDKAVKITKFVDEYLKNDSNLGWEDFIPITYSSIKNSERIDFIFSANSPAAQIGLHSGDLLEVRVASHAEWFRSIIFPSRRDGSEQIIPSIREQHARNGYFAEPVLYFPLGEIVNGIRLMIDELHQNIGNPDAGA